MTTNTTTGIAPVAAQPRHTLFSDASLWSVSAAVEPSLRLVAGRCLSVPLAERHDAAEIGGGVRRRGPVMSHLMGIAMSGGRSVAALWTTCLETSTTLQTITHKSIDDPASDLGGHRGSDATDGKFSTRSGLRPCSPPV